MILHGVPGSGKTNYIRHLVFHINEYTNENCNIILITGDQISLILRPDFIDYLSELCNEKLTYLVLEDCEQLIKKREKDEFFSKVSEILNISDGLYSDIFRIKIIATFNTDESNVDPALLRPGRLIEKVFFEELDEIQCNLLLKKHNVNVCIDNPMTLSEVFEIIEKNKNKVVPNQD